MEISFSREGGDNLPSGQGNEMASDFSGKCRCQNQP